jgi:hypothetical protein
MNETQIKRIAGIREVLELADILMTDFINAEIAESLTHEEEITSNKLTQQMALQLFLLKEMLCNVEDIR